MTEETTSFFAYRRKILADTKSRLSHLNNSGIIIFMAACCQRQVSVYDRASLNQSWSDTALIKKLLEGVWKHLLKNDSNLIKEIETSSNLLEILSSALPEDPYGDVDNCAITCVSNIEVLFEAIKNPQVEYAITVSEEALEILSTLLYSSLNVNITSTSDVEIYGHRLMQLEIDRQLHDISKLIQPFNYYTIQEIYNNSINIDLTDGLWWKT